MSAIRPLEATDAASWRELRLRGLRTDARAFGQTYEEAAAQTPEGNAARFTPEALVEVPIFGAFVDGELVGTCGLFREKGLKNRHKATLWGMYVDAAARGRGLGEALLEAAIARARTMPGVLQINLTVWSENANAARLYAKHGFEVYGRERRSLRHEGVDDDEDLMVLHLAPLS
jgi:ribosomal protein S18 acetylase RimI-like enzyme